MKLTENDVRKIEEEIKHRKLVVRPEALEAVKEARAHGDLSENFEYHAAKRDKNKNESRIRYLERILKTAEVISDDSKDDEVGIDNTVEIYFEDDDETETYKLVTTMRGDSLAGRISTESPIGKAIMGHKAGERVEVKVNDDVSYFVVIKSIKNTTDEASDEIRKY
ncbi:MAG: transcription elongation factor GreA [Lachnospiraceae bacterium]|nr:transcription elongation factor GreA [Lachnospiraceae bacterium]